MNKTLHHKYYDELIPAYAIGAADDEDCRALEEHLATCGLCCVRLQEFQDLEQGMRFAIPAASARFGMTEDLRSRIAPVTSAPAPRQGRRAVLRHPLLWLGFAVLALLVVSNLYWANRVGRIQHETEVLAAILEAPGTALQATANLPYGRGVVYAPAGASKGLLCVYGLPALPDDRTYQAWLVQDGQRTSAGTFRVNGEGDGVLLLRAGQPLASFDSLGITEEPAGGSPAPTGPRLLGGKL